MHQNLAVILQQNQFCSIAPRLEIYFLMNISWKILVYFVFSTQLTLNVKFCLSLDSNFGSSSNWVTTTTPVRLEIFFSGPLRPHFIYFRLFCQQLTIINCSIKLPVTGFKPWSSGMWSSHAANCATTTAPERPKIFVRYNQLGRLPHLPTCPVTLTTFNDIKVA